MDPDGAPDGCPPQIDPSSSFRLDVKCASYPANLDYGVLEMAEQEHELWMDYSGAYNLDKFREDMSTLMIWGTSHAIDLWAVDSNCDAK
ncbi:hypothetical protein BS78_05G139100 [Paspalum vaginatum]|nr:hypothetical protein BS78_05G139100 [Paspalum vaginatum]